MGSERRRALRWRACSHQHTVRVRRADGGKSVATVVDVSKTGVGLRDNRRNFAVGMRVALEMDLHGETIEANGVVRFIDRFFPRIGIHIDSNGVMEKAIRHAERRGFVASEARGDTLAISGSLTLSALKEFKSAPGYRKLDLSGVREASVAGASIVLGAARKGARIDCCSRTIAPLFDTMGICDAGVCVSRAPCDLPKNWLSLRDAGDAD
jgi:hypothetical protein